MYEEHYGLTARPFQMTPDPEFLYWSGSHKLAFTMLRYSLLNASPLTVITGDVGTGKTTLVRRLLDEFPGDMRVGLLSNVQAGRGDLLEWMLMAFEQPYDGNHVERFQRFEQFAVACYGEGRHLAVIIDEAHNVGIDQLEELRLLSNINSGGDMLLQIILVGQPELREMLGRPELRQFAQRITADFDLSPLGADEVAHYIAHRLAVAGCEDELFPRSTCELIARATRGIPRLINILCDLCLVYGYSSESPVIEEGTLRKLMADMENNGIFRQFSPIGSGPTLVSSSDGKSKSETKPGTKSAAKSAAKSGTNSRIAQRTSKTVHDES